MATDACFMSAYKLMCRAGDAAEPSDTPLILTYPTDLPATSGPSGTRTPCECASSAQ